MVTVGYTTVRRVPSRRLIETIKANLSWPTYGRVSISLPFELDRNESLNAQGYYWVELMSISNVAFLRIK